MADHRREGGRRVPGDAVRIAEPATRVLRVPALASVATPSARRAARLVCFRIVFVTSVGSGGEELSNPDVMETPGGAK